MIQVHFISSTLIITMQALRGKLPKIGTHTIFYQSAVNLS
jgi:hypothetical protein